MIGIEKPSIEALDLTADGTYGKFVVEPLERGYGTTLGNSLRRVLLSSLLCAAAEEDPGQNTDRRERERHRM